MLFLLYNVNQLYIYIYPLPLEPLSRFLRSHPSRSSESTELSSLWYTAAPHWWSISHVALCICQCCCCAVLSRVWLFLTSWTAACPGSSVHAIFQARILEWVAIASSRVSSPLRNWTWVSCISCFGRRILYHWATWEGPIKISDIVSNWAGNLPDPQGKIPFMDYSLALAEMACVTTWSYKPCIRDGWVTVKSSGKM